MTTDWDKLLEETGAICREQIKDAYERGYRWGLIEGRRQGNKETLSFIKEKIIWKT